MFILDILVGLMIVFGAYSIRNIVEHTFMYDMAFVSGACVATLGFGTLVGKYLARIVRLNSRQATVVAEPSRDKIRTALRSTLVVASIGIYAAHIMEEIELAKLLTVTAVIGATATIVVLRVFEEIDLKVHRSLKQPAQPPPIPKREPPVEVYKNSDAPPEVMERITRPLNPWEPPPPRN